MGCVQTNPTILPVNRLQIEQISSNGDFQTNPIVINPQLKPTYVRSSLKKVSTERRPDRLVINVRKPQPFNKSVKFDQQVLVMTRTPTPNKIWYEKESTTMPMRTEPFDDENDDYDEDNEQQFVDGERESNQQFNSKLQLPKLGPAVSLIQRNPNNSWYSPNATEFTPAVNIVSDNETNQLTSQQSLTTMDMHGTTNQNIPAINRIKVRRKLPELGLPQIAPASHQIPVPTSATATNQASGDTPLYRPSLSTGQQPRVSRLHRSTLPTPTGTVHQAMPQSLVQQSTAQPINPTSYQSSAQSSTQSSTTAPYQSTIQPIISSVTYQSSNQSSIQPPTTNTYQSSSQPTTGSSYQPVSQSTVQVPTQQSTVNSS